LIYFLDSSALVKRYVRETGSATVAHDLVERHPLRAYDAVQLASALRIVHSTAALSLSCAPTAVWQARRPRRVSGRFECEGGGGKAAFTYDTYAAMKVRSAGMRVISVASLALVEPLAASTSERIVTRVLLRGHCHSPLFSEAGPTPTCVVGFS
jgi:hypothetical protein